MRSRHQSACIHLLICAPYEDYLTSLLSLLFPLFKLSTSSRESAYRRMFRFQAEYRIRWLSLALYLLLCSFFWFRIFSYVSVTKLVDFMLKCSVCKIFGKQFFNDIFKNIFPEVVFLEWYLKRLRSHCNSWAIRHRKNTAQEALTDSTEYTIQKVVLFILFCTDIWRPYFYLVLNDFLVFPRFKRF